MSDPETSAKSRSRDLVKSMARWPWAMMVGGARLGGRAFWTPASAVALGGAEGLVREAQSRFDDALGAVSSAGDRLQAAAVDWAFDTSGQRLDVKRWTPLALGLLEDTSRAAGSAMWPRGEIPWLELRNKLEAFRCFDSLEGEAPVPGADPYSSLWAMEGCGHRLAERAWEEGVEPRGLLRPSARLEMPDGSRVPLHAGMGLSLATRCLAAFAEPLTDGDLRRASALRLARSSGVCRRSWSRARRQDAVNGMACVGAK